MKTHDNNIYWDLNGRANRKKKASKSKRFRGVYRRLFDVSEKISTKRGDAQVSSGLGLLYQLPAALPSPSCLRRNFSII